MPAAPNLLLAGFALVFVALVQAQPPDREPPRQVPAELTDVQLDELDCEEDLERWLGAEPIPEDERLRRAAAVHRSRLARRLTPELLECILEVTREIDPPLSKRLRRVKERDPKRFEAAIVSTGRRLIGLAELKLRDPKLYRIKLGEFTMERQVTNTAQRLRNAMAGGQGDVESLSKELRNQLRILVGYSIASRTLFLRRLQDHLQEIKREIDHEAANFDETVDERFHRLVQGTEETPSSETTFAPTVATDGKRQPKASR